VILAYYAAPCVPLKLAVMSLNQAGNRKPANPRFTYGKWHVCVCVVFMRSHLTWIRRIWRYIYTELKRVCLDGFVAWNWKKGKERQRSGTGTVSLIIKKSRLRCSGHFELQDDDDWMMSIGWKAVWRWRLMEQDTEVIRGRPGGTQSRRMWRVWAWPESQGINGEGQPANPGPPGKMAVRAYTRAFNKTRSAAAAAAAATGRSGGRLEWSFDETRRWRTPVPRHLPHLLRAFSISMTTSVDSAIVGGLLCANTSQSTRRKRSSCTRHCDWCVYSDIHTHTQTDMPLQSSSVMIQVEGKGWDAPYSSSPSFCSFIIFFYVSNCFCANI